MKSVAKSLLLAFMGTGLLFFFLMMTVTPIMALMARVGGDVAQKSVVVNPGIFLRAYGIPMAGVAFVVLFAISMYRLRRVERGQLVHHH